MHETHETLRKSLHIAFGAGALTLRFFPWPVAAAIAALGVIGNWLLLHRIVGKRVARHERGYDAGIVIYPAAVLALILIFRHRIEIAGVVWAILAFGDGFATLAGRAIGGPRLPWNRAKTWSGFGAFLAFGFVGAEVTYLWLRTAATNLAPLTILIGTVLAAAIAESLALNIDDNLVVPLAAAPVMAVLVHAVAPPAPLLGTTAMIWLVMNTVLALLGYVAKSVDLSGFIGGWMLGAVIILFGGWQLYVVLLAFFVIGTGTTKLGYRRKAHEGLAQEGGGRRGFSHAFSNVGMAAMLAVAATMLDPRHASWGMAGAITIWMAAAASLATAAADTSASEVGQLIGKRTYLPLTFRPVPRGTEGAVSLEGTLVGIVAGVCVAAVAVWARFRSLPPHGGLSYEVRWLALLAFAAVAGSYLESIVGSWNRRQEKPLPNGALNFFNTASGASIAMLLAPAVARLS